MRSTLKHETQTTETFTRVSYTCDVCEKVLLDGQRPRLCGICGREVCGRDSCWQRLEIDGEMDSEVVCAYCQATQDDARARIQGTLRVAYEHCDEIRAVWKRRSLAHKE